MPQCGGPFVGCGVSHRPAALLQLLISLILAGGIVGAAVAQVPVKESSAVGERAFAEPVAARPSVAQGADTARLGELFHRLQVLQQEVRELRGQVEEQAYRIERLTRQQQQQYIDLDQRLVALRGQGPAAATPGRQGSSMPSTPRPTLPPAGSAPPEREAYTAAFNMMQEGRYEDSADAFNRLITGYPNGQFTPNAFYWLGELHLAMEDVEMARQSFAQVLTLYPGHGKAPDALYKLGVVHHRLNDNERALEYLNRVIAEHPDTSAAGLARTYAQELR